MAKAQRKDDILKSELPPALPLMALRSTIVYPLGTIAVQMGAPENLSLLRANESSGLIVALVVASGDHDEPIDQQRFRGRVGVAARVHERINLPGDTVQITLQGLRRIVDRGSDADRSVSDRQHPAGDGDAGRACGARRSRRARGVVGRDARRAGGPHSGRGAGDPQDERLRSRPVRRPGGDEHELQASPTRTRCLQRLDVGQRLRFILSRLEREVARARVMEDVKKQTEVKIEQHQREFYLRQQLRAIQAELGEADPGEKEAIDLLKKIEDAKLPEKVAQEARRETERMRMLSPASSEYQVVRTYLDWVLSLPWNKRSGEDGDRPQEDRRSARQPALRARRGEGAHHRVPRRAQAARRRSARPDSLLRRTAGHRQDVTRRSDRQVDRARVLSHLRRRRCATRPRFAATVARTSARCPG